MKTILIALLAVGSLAHAAKRPQLNYAPEVKMTAQELLSLPPENRMAVARGRGVEFSKDLEKIAFAKTEDYGTRWKALTLVAQLKGAQSETLLQKALKSPEWYMRNAALVAYQEVLPKRSRTVAGELLNDKALVVRSAAVSALGPSMGEEAVRESLWEQLSSSANFRKKQSLFIRGQILEALAQNPREKEMPLFIKHLGEEDARLHAPAVAALEKVTARKMGKKNDTLAQKRDLWMKWAKAQDSTVRL